MPTAKKTTRKRATRKKKVRQEIQNLGLVIAEACREARRELPEASYHERREWAVSLLNATLDIPLRTEDHEERLLALLFDVVSDIIFKRRYGGHRQDLNTAAELIAKLKS